MPSPKVDSDAPAEEVFVAQTEPALEATFRTPARADLRDPTRPLGYRQLDHGLVGPGWAGKDIHPFDRREVGDPYCAGVHLDRSQQSTILHQESLPQDPFADMVEAGESHPGNGSLYPRLDLDFHLPPIVFPNSWNRSDASLVETGILIVPPNATGRGIEGVAVERHPLLNPDRGIGSEVQGIAAGNPYILDQLERTGLHLDVYHLPIVSY